MFAVESMGRYLVYLLSFYQPPFMCFDLKNPEVSGERWDNLNISHTINRNFNMFVELHDQDVYL